MAIEPTDHQRWDLRVATNGRATRATEGGRVLALEGAPTRVIARHTPADLELHAVDADGAALGLRTGRLFRLARGARTWSVVPVRLP